MEALVLMSQPVFRTTSFETLPTHAFSAYRQSVCTGCSLHTSHLDSSDQTNVLLLESSVQAKASHKKTEGGNSRN